MRNIFRRRRPAHRAEPVAPLLSVLSRTDRLVAAWWGYTPQQWADLPAMVRADKRETVTWAPKLGVRK